MRKLLLASVATLGLTTGMADTGLAQSANDAGQASVDAGQSTGPAPGTITVRLNGRFRFYAGGYWESGQNASYYYASNGTVSANPFYTVGADSKGAVTTTRASQGFFKTQPFSFQSYGRLYPGFDGVAANGLKYGASLEIRQDNNGQSGGTGAASSISSSTRQKALLYFRREWGYVGTPSLGTIRVGATDGPSGLFMTGNFENFNDGGWNGDVPSFFNNGGLAWPFADVGNMYTTEKVVYLSPQFYGFDFGAAFEPTTAAVTGDGSAGCNAPYYLGGAFVGSGSGIAGPGCDRLSSTTNNEYRRRRNTGDIAVRYRGTFGAVGFAAFVNYIGSSLVSDGGAVVYNSTTGVTSISPRTPYNGLNVGVFGTTLTFGGLQVGGMVQGGNVNGQWASQIKHTPAGLAWLVGTSYTIGPVVVGSHFFNYASAGAYTPGSTVVGRTRRDLGLAAGGTYSVAPGLALFLSYLWGQAHQHGADVTGLGNTNVAGGPFLHNTYNNQAFVLGTSFTW